MNRKNTFFFKVDKSEVPKLCNILKSRGCYNLVAKPNGNWNVTLRFCTKEIGKYFIMNLEYLTNKEIYSVNDMYYWSAA